MEKQCVSKRGCSGCSGECGYTHCAHVETAVAGDESLSCDMPVLVVDGADGMMFAWIRKE